MGCGDHVMGQSCTRTFFGTVLDGALILLLAQDYLSAARRSDEYELYVKMARTAPHDHDGVEPLLPYDQAVRNIRLCKLWHERAERMLAMQLKHDVPIQFTEYSGRFGLYVRDALQRMKAGKWDGWERFAHDKKNRVSYPRHDELSHHLPNYMKLSYRLG